ncbi:cold shock domain-containing protein [Pontibacter akesuensis]|uniref:Cold-shock DNA-binding protein family n=1 Tax=Pontibacter akesuensis TaxID=388950 RepID=A0A1I7GML7_9BACT|nr:cold shock domain-containing protein [Pontibacter akesuensis]GHA55955.1 cold-shock protein [Pontibacter akesuensis]SFU49752.1 cold-shock DNA-binding protein family [Pontibacter akesuensis]
MGRSQETFSKKEKEKKRLKKRQDKEQKKEERQANSDKGKGIEEMMAYVDENGNITDTPPDPTRKKAVIKQEDIQISVSKQADLDPADSIRKGTITFFNESKGYGFIRDHDTQESIFVHQNEMIDKVGENAKVTFEVEMGQKGLNAVRVKAAV